MKNTEKSAYLLFISIYRQMCRWRTLLRSWMPFVKSGIRKMLKKNCSDIPLTGLPTLSGYAALSGSSDLTVAKCYKLNFVIVIYSL